MPPHVTTCRIDAVKETKTKATTVLFFDQLVYGSLNLAVCGALRVAFYLDNDAIYFTSDGIGYRSFGLVAFNRVEITGQFSDYCACHYSLNHHVKWPVEHAQRVALAAVANAAQGLTFHHLNKAPYPVGQSLVAFILAMHRFFKSNASIEESLCYLLNQKKRLPHEQCDLVFCLTTYTQLFGLAFIKNHGTAISGLFWQHLAMIDDEGRLYMPKNGLDDDAFIGLQALSFRALLAYSQLFDWLGNHELQVKSRALYYKKDAVTLYPLSASAAAQVVLAQMDSDGHAACFLKQHAVDDHQIENVYDIGQALLAINQKKLLQSYLANFNPNDNQANLCLAAWLLLC